MYWIPAGSLGLWDFVVILAMLLLSASVGVFSTFRCRGGLRKVTLFKEEEFSDAGDGFNRHLHSEERKPERLISGYVVGNRQMGVIPTALSIAATTLSGSTMIGHVAEVYLYGTQYIFFALGGFIGLVFAALVVVPVYRKIPYFSIYEYLERRFDRSVRLIFSTIYIVAKMFLVSVALYAPVICCSTLTSLPSWISLLVTGTVCLCYSALGGIKAVVYTDVLQIIFMVCCNVLIIVTGIIKVGGVENVWQLNIKGQRVGHLTLLEDSYARYSIWSLTFGGMIIMLNEMCAGQTGVQRILSVRGIKQAQTSTLLGAALVFVFLTLIVVVASVLYAVVYSCDPLLNFEHSGVENPDELLPYGIKTLLSGTPGFQGLAMAGIFSGSMSTFSSYINSFATLSIEDFILPCLKKNGKTLTDVIKLRLYRVLSLLFGCVCIILASLVPLLGGVVRSTILVTGATGGCLTAVIFLAIFCKKANKKGVLIGLFFGLTLTTWLAVGASMNRLDLKHLPLSDEGCLVKPENISRSTILITTDPSTDSTTLPYDPNSSPTEPFLIGQVIFVKEVTAFNYSVNATTEVVTSFVLNTVTLKAHLIESSTIIASLEEPFNKTVFNSTVLALIGKGANEEVFILYRLSFMWYGLLGCLVTFLVGLVFSEVFSDGANQKFVDPRLLSTFIKDSTCKRSKEDKGVMNRIPSEVSNEISSRF